MNALYDQYAKLTPEDVQKAAAKYLVDNGRTIVTLTGPGRREVKFAHGGCCCWRRARRRRSARSTLPGKSPLVTFRIVFTTGSAADPADKPGLANLTAHDARRRRHEGPDLQADRRTRFSRWRRA